MFINVLKFNMLKCESNAYKNPCCAATQLGVGGTNFEN